MADTEWFAHAGWGVFCHYLTGPQTTADEWNRQVDAFDVAALARQLASVGAGHFFITVGQGSGHYCAPNETYDAVAGVRPSKCSRRDLVADLYDDLSARGIALLVYLPSGAPAADPVAMERLEWEWGYEGKWPEAWRTRRTGKRLAAFQTKWEAIVREWSTRWGRKIRGWWIDGCYFADEMYRHEDEPNFRSFAAALKAGNPEAIVAFNPGVMTPVVCHTRHEDYTAGEVSRQLPGVCPGPWIEGEGIRSRYHTLSYLGRTWGQGDKPRFSDEVVIQYTKDILSKGGFVSWDVPPMIDGRIPDAFVKQLKSLRDGLANER